MTPYHHAESSVNKFGGRLEDYIAIHEWFDCTKAYTGDWTHRALRHHAAGVQWAVDHFGHRLTLCTGACVPVKLVAEQHVWEDCGRIPTVESWLRALRESPEDWMLKVQMKSAQLVTVAS